MLLAYAFLRFIEPETLDYLMKVAAVTVLVHRLHLVHEHSAGLAHRTAEQLTTSNAYRW